MLILCPSMIIRKRLCAPADQAALCDANESFRTYVHVAAIAGFSKPDGHRSWPARSALMLLASSSKRLFGPARLPNTLAFEDDDAVTRPQLVLLPRSMTGSQRAWFTEGDVSMFCILGLLQCRFSTNRL
jgi:hypothetical protein